MDRIEHYRQIVRAYLEEYAQESVSPNEDVTAELVFDEKRDRFLLMHVGWRNKQRIYGCPMQIDIIKYCRRRHGAGLSVALFSRIGCR